MACPAPAAAVVVVVAAVVVGIEAGSGEKLLTKQPANPALMAHGKFINISSHWRKVTVGLILLIGI